MWPYIVTNLFLIKPTRPTNFPNFILSKKLYRFRVFPLPIVRSFLLYIRHWCISCRSDDSSQAGSGGNRFQVFPVPIVRNFLQYIRHWCISCWSGDSSQAGSECSILTLLGNCHQTCKKYTNVECTVENSWRWAREIPETCRVFWQNKIWEIGFIKKKYILFYSTRSYNKLLYK